MYASTPDFLKLSPITSENVAGRIKMSQRTDKAAVQLVRELKKD